MVRDIHFTIPPDNFYVLANHLPSLFRVFLYPAYVVSDRGIVNFKECLTLRKRYFLTKSRNPDRIGWSFVLMSLNAMPIRKRLPKSFTHFTVPVTTSSFPVFGSDSKEIYKSTFCPCSSLLSE